MILEEALYNPLMPKDQRGRDAWFRQPVTSSHLGKRQRSEGGDKDDGRDLFTDRRKLRRTVSSKHSEQSSKVWNDIASHSVDPRQSSEAVPLVLRSMSARSEDPAVKARDSEGLAQARHDPTKDRNPIHSMKLLDGQAFFIHGFDAKRASIIKRHLGSHGAVVYTDPREAVDKTQRTYLLVPHDLCASDAAKQGVELVKNEFVKSTVVTDWWLEKCLESKTIMRRSAVPGGVPFAGFPLSGIAKMKITCTGYLNTDLMHVSKMTALAGARYSGNLEDDTTILLCNPANMLRGDKIKHAWRTGIPTVSGRWLSESLASARMLDTAPYLLQEPNQRSPRKGLPRSEMASRLEGREAQRAKLSSRENQLREKPSVLLTDGLRSPSSKLRVARNSRAVHASTSTEVPPSKPADSHEQNPTGAEKRGSHEIAQGKGKPKILPHQGESGPLLSPKLANSTEHTEHVPAKKTVQVESGSSAEIQHDKPGPGLNDEISSLLAYQTARRLQRTASELTAATGSPSKNIQGLSRTNSEVLTSQNSPSKSHRRKLFGKARNGSSSIEGASFSTFATAKSTVSESTPAVPSLSSKTSEQFAMDLGWGVDEEPQKPTLPPPTQQLVYDDPEAKRHRERVQRKAAQARNRADKDQAGDDAVNGAMWEKVVSPRRPMLAVDSVGPAATAGQGRAGKTSRRRQTRSACQVAG